MLVFHFIPMASSHCSRCLPAVLILWEADQLPQPSPLEDSWVSTADTLWLLALSWPPMRPPSVNRGSRSAKLAVGPGQPWVSRSTGGPSTYAPAPSCEVQEQMEDQYQLSWELRAGMEGEDTSSGMETGSPAWRNPAVGTLQPELTIRMLPSSWVGCCIAFIPGKRPGVPPLLV